MNGAVSALQPGGGVGVVGALDGQGEARAGTRSAEPR